jgi:hypothetical protein
MKKTYLLYAILGLLTINILSEYILLFRDVLDIKALDNEIALLSFHQDQLKSNNEGNSPQAELERQVLLLKLRDYIWLRDEHPYFSRKIRLGSQSVFNEVLKYKMCEALQLKQEKASVRFITNGLKIQKK